jgi:signal transduction histidine kinase
MVRAGVREHVARVLAATPSLRVSWFAAAMLAIGFSTWAARTNDRGLLFFLIVAPLLPLAGVAAAYGAWIDPMYEVTHAAPISGLRVLLLRSAAVLVATIAVMGVAAALIPAADWRAAAWILPSLALTLAGVALSTFLPVHWAGGGVTLGWLATVLAAGLASGDGFAVFRGTGQVAFFGIVVGSSFVVAWRRERLQVEGRAQRLRMIEAAENERRRIERNIHDGAQQQLVALSVKLGLARTIVARDPAGADAVLAELQAEAQDALEGLRDMTRGTYPPILADEGLVVALEARARKAPLPVSVAGDDIGRLPREIESAVYFCCLEALQNTAKYARASRATVAVRRIGAELSFTVIDDGVGFDPTTVRHGVGLRSMAERVEALGGGLEVRSADGGGTTIVGRIRLRSADGVTSAGPRPSARERS